MTNPSSSKPRPPQPTPIHLISIARRAHLSYRLQTKKKEALGKLEVAKTYDSSVRAANFRITEITFHDQILLTGICGVLEAFLTDICTEFLICFPAALDTKQISFESFSKKGSLAAVVRELAEKEINDVSYKTFPEAVTRLQEIANIKKPLDGKLVAAMNEVKCTRDVYVHGKGKVNHIYLRKTGAAARGKLDAELPLGKDYLFEAIDLCETFIDKFFAGGPANYLHFTNLRAFREMWEATHLNAVMPFDVAWQEIGGIPRPSNKAFKWLWSHSEQALFDFFLGIFNPHHKKRKMDTLEVLARFPSSTPEGQVVISWMDSPFWL